MVENGPKLSSRWLATEYGMNGLHSTKWFLTSGVVICLTGCSRLLPNLPDIDLEVMHGPVYIENAIRAGAIRNFNPSKARIATQRWKKAIDGAKNASREMPILREINISETALLVVDMQRAFLDPGAAIEVTSGRGIVPNINKLATEIRQGGGKVVFFRYLVNENAGLLKHFERQSYLGNDRESPLEALQKGHPQFELYPELDIEEDDIIMDKIRYSAVLGSSIVDTLNQYHIKNVIITGVTTDVCAGNTAEDLMQKDFFVVVVWDGTAALDRLEHELSLARIYGLYGDVMPTEEIILRLNKKEF